MVAFSAKKKPFWALGFAGNTNLERKSTFQNRLYKKYTKRKNTKQPRIESSEKSSEYCSILFVESNLLNNYTKSMEKYGKIQSSSKLCIQKLSEISAWWHHFWNTVPAVTPHVLAARCARCLTLVSDTCQRPQRCSILQFLESIWSFGHPKLQGAFGEQSTCNFLKGDERSKYIII